MNAPFSWSYTRYKAWHDCPKQYQAKFVTKTIKDEKSPAMLRGQKIHEGVAAYIEGKAPLLPGAGEMAKFNSLMAQLKFMDPAYRLIEQQWAFTSKWEPTGWFSKGPVAAWLRVVLDVAVLYPDWDAEVIDHKTGKRYDSNEEQNELFALAVFKTEPRVQSVTTRLWYLDDGGETTAAYHKRDEAALTTKWEKAVAPMAAEEVFAPRPGNQCRYCPLARSNGGDCRFG